MALLPIVRLGSLVLRKKSTPVSLSLLRTKKFQKFLDDLVATCVHANGAGIAAPQVGVNKRVIIVSVQLDNARYPSRPFFPSTIIVNPVVVERSKKLAQDWEGDLSAHLQGMVPRSISAVVRGLDRHGKLVIFRVKGFHARVFQHEIDHLDGFFFTDRMTRVETLAEI